MEVPQRSQVRPGMSHAPISCAHARHRRSPRVMWPSPTTAVRCHHSPGTPPRRRPAKGDRLRTHETRPGLLAAPAIAINPKPGARRARFVQYLRRIRIITPLLRRLGMRRSVGLAAASRWNVCRDYNGICACRLQERPSGRSGAECRGFDQRTKEIAMNVAQLCPRPSPWGDVIRAARLHDDPRWQT